MCSSTICRRGAPAHDAAAPALALYAGLDAGDDRCLAERLTGSCEAAGLLEDFRKRNYFTTRDGAAQVRYRFHALFRDFLLAGAHDRLAHQSLFEAVLSALNTGEPLAGRAVFTILRGTTFVVETAASSIVDPTVSTLETRSVLARWCEMVSQEIIERKRQAKIRLLKQDIAYQKRYIVGLQNAELFPSAYAGLWHLEKLLKELVGKLQPEDDVIGLNRRLRSTTMNAH